MNKVLKILLVICGSIAAIVAILIILAFRGTHLLSRSMPDGDAARRDVQSAVDNISLPPDVSYVRKDSVGDPLDSPAEFGWRYTYSYKDKADNATVADTYLKNLSSAGYIVEEPTINERKSVVVKAKNSAQNVKIYGLFGTTNATVTAQVINYEEYK